MPQREQQEARRELSLGPPSSLPTVVGNLAQLNGPITDPSGLPAAQGMPGVQPTYPSGSIDSITQPQLPPVSQLDRQPMVQLPEPAQFQSRETLTIPEPRAPERPQTPSPFQPSGRDHQAEQYGPSFWSQSWQQRML